MAASRMPYLAAVSQDGEAYPLLAKAEFMVVGVPGGLVAWLNTTTVAIDKNITYLPALSYLTDSVGNLLAKYSGDTVARFEQAGLQGGPTAGWYDEKVTDRGVCRLG
eukprot:TRINITY_DN5431_c0_g1_i6.p1 TRINITY_DN5431_c0_g1~~TRINITY_DN5431_c0_g1_i6.p1  ORF type:complete len:107 (-),score=17.92 TRINITY_DN5431_c0_g1_i6:127-447(-)